MLSNKDATQKLAKANREIDLLNKQLNDTGRQVQTLLREVARRDDPTLPADEVLDADTSLQPAENIEEVITNNLVLFKSIGALQEQNQKLLHIVRDLGAKMEAEEREYKHQLEEEQSKAVMEAHEAIMSLQQQLESVQTLRTSEAQAWTKEREAYKAIVKRAEAAGVPGASAALTNGDAPVPAATNGHAHAMAVDGDYAELHDRFETFKTEMSADARRSREDAATALRDKGKAEAELAKAKAKIEYIEGNLGSLALFATSC